MPDLILVLTNSSVEAEAEAIAEAAIDQHLAAAVQIIGPVRSIYRWQGKTERTEEWICLLKTSQAHYLEVERLIQSLHSYDLPGILAIPVVGGSEDYLHWFAGQLQPSA